MKYIKVIPRYCKHHKSVILKYTPPDEIGFEECYLWNHLENQWVKECVGRPATPPNLRNDILIPLTEEELFAELL
jgi:hypothetical protein